MIQDDPGSEITEEQNFLNQTLGLKKLSVVSIRILRHLFFALMRLFLTRSYRKGFETWEASCFQGCSS